MYILLNIFDAESLIRYGGLLLAFFLIYGSVGLFFCFFIPSGAILFAAGMLTATGGISHSIFIVCSILVLASIAGNITGYWFGRKTGPLLYKREDSRFFKKQHLTTAETFYKKYGAFALTIGLYLPIVRTFASIVAGLVRLNFKRFILLTSAGSAVWVVSFVLAGYLVGSMPLLKEWSTYIILAFVFLVTVPLVFRIIKEYKKLRKEKSNKE